MSGSTSTHIELDANERDRLKASRDWVKGHFTENADEKYEPLEGKLRLIDAILSNRYINPDETWKLQSLGIVLGDAIVQKLMMDWVIVVDEFGRDPALHWPGTSIYSYPMTMISKRVEQGIDVDVYELFDDVCATITDVAFSGKAE